MNHQEMIETLLKSPNCTSLNSSAALIEIGPSTQRRANLVIVVLLQ